MRYPSAACVMQAIDTDASNDDKLGIHWDTKCKQKVMLKIYGVRAEYEHEVKVMCVSRGRRGWDVVWSGSCSATRANIYYLQK